MQYTESKDEELTWSGLYQVPEMQCSMTSFAIAEDPYNEGTYYMVWVNGTPNYKGSMYERSRPCLVKSTDGKNWEFVMNCERMANLYSPQNGQLIYQVIDPSLLVTKEHVFVTFGRSSKEFSETSAGSHQAQRAYCIRVEKDKLKTRDWDASTVSNMNFPAKVEIEKYPQTKFGLGDIFNSYNATVKITALNGKVRTEDFTLNSKVYSEPNMFKLGKQVISATYSNGYPLDYEIEIVPNYNIVWKLSDGGTVEPKKNRIMEGATEEIKLVPDEGYKVVNATINGKKVRTINNVLKLKNIDTNLEIEIEFSRVSVWEYLFVGSSTLALAGVLNHLHILDISRNGKRPMFFSRYSGFGSHRYPVGFSGDTIITWKSLNFQPYFTANASNVGYSWWSHDIGGHMCGSRDDELTVRWMQLGVFSPINRLHASDNIFASKEPWNLFPYEAGIAKDWLRLRHRLFPYIYTMNYRNHSELVPMVLPMYYSHPEKDVAYRYHNQYWFGSELIVSPITEPNDKRTRLGKAKVWLPEGKWIDAFNGYVYQGDREIEVYRNLEQMPIFAKAGAIVPMQKYMGDNKLGHSKDMELFVFAGADNRFAMYEDVGDYSNYQNGAFVETLIATDFDGTLNYNGIDEKKLKAICEWRAAGNIFGVVSGRGPDFLSELSDLLCGNFDFFISCNGGYATDNRGEVLFEEHCDCVPTREFVMRLLQWGAPMVHIYYEDKLVRVVMDDFSEEYDYILDEMSDIPIFHKISTVLENAEKTEWITSKVKEEYGTLVNPLPNKRWLDICPQGVDKAEGVRRLCHVLGIEKDKVVVAGDALNDMSMIKEFRSYAMDHGDARLKASAMCVVNSIEDLIMRELE